MVPGLSSTNQRENLEPISFMPEDHYKVMEMRPHIKNMVHLIKQHAKDVLGDKDSNE